MTKLADLIWKNAESLRGAFKKANTARLPLPASFVLCSLEMFKPSNLPDSTQSEAMFSAAHPIPARKIKSRA